MERHNREKAQFVQMQLVYAMQTARTARETADIADAMSNAKSFWELVIRQDDILNPRLVNCCGASVSKVPDASKDKLMKKHEIEVAFEEDK